MQVTINSTAKIVTLNGVPARIWEGQTASGIPVHCFLVRVAVNKDQDTAQFDRELLEMRAPSAAVENIPFRLIL